MLTALVIGLIATSLRMGGVARLPTYQPEATSMTSAVGKVSRGDAPELGEPDSFTLLPSPIEGVDDLQWTRFVSAMATQEVSAISPTLSLGAFEMKPRRLHEMGLLDDLHTVTTASGRKAQAGRFADPVTVEQFLSSPHIQYATLAASVVGHCEDVKAGKVKIPAGMSLSGALAVLHKAGRGGLGKELFEETARVFEKANNLF